MYCGSCRSFSASRRATRCSAADYDDDATVTSGTDINRRTNKSIWPDVVTKATDCRDPLELRLIVFTVNMIERSEAKRWYEEQGKVGW